MFGWANKCPLETDSLAFLVEGGRAMRSPEESEMKPVPEAGSRGLAVTMLGSMQVSWQGRLVAFPTCDSEVLFAFLALNRPKTFTRDVLVGTFWPELPDPSARKRLRTALWRLRATLDEHVSSEEVVHVSRNRLSASSEIDIDVDRFERGVRRGLDRIQKPTSGSKELSELEAALGVYRGDLLEGQYDDWCQSERERLRVLYLDTLECMTRRYACHGDWQAALNCGRRILERDPLREHIHREVMALYYLAGDRPRALRQFRQCRETLKEELDVAPMRSTLQVRRALETEDIRAIEAVVEP